MYFIFDMPVGDSTVRHIVQRRNDGVLMFRFGDDEGLDKMYLDWVAEGNEPEEWTGE